MRFFGTLSLFAAMVACPAAAQTPGGLGIRQMDIDGVLAVTMPRPSPFASPREIDSWRFNVGPGPQTVRFAATEGDAVFVGAACLVLPRGTERCRDVQMEVLTPNGESLGVVSNPLQIGGVAPYSGEYTVRITARSCPGEGCRVGVTASKLTAGR